MPHPWRTENWALYFLLYSFFYLLFLSFVLFFYLIPIANFIVIYKNIYQLISFTFSFTWACNKIFYFCLLRSVQTDTGAHPDSYSTDTEGSLPGRGQQPALTAHQSPTSKAGIKNQWSYSSVPICLHSLYRDNCTCTFTYKRGVLFTRHQSPG